MTSPQPTAIPLDAPYYGASIGTAFARFWQKYATFSGRASRSEYWWWYLIATLVNIVFNILSFSLGGYGLQMDGTYATPSAGASVVYVLWGIWALATIIPGLAILVRRLHDTNRSGFWVLIGLVPFVGGIILLVFTVLASDPAGARFDRR